MGRSWRALPGPGSDWVAAIASGRMARKRVPQPKTGGPYASVYLSGGRSPGKMMPFHETV